VGFCACESGSYPNSSAGIFTGFKLQNRLSVLILDKRYFDRSIATGGSPGTQALPARQAGVIGQSL